MRSNKGTNTKPEQVVRKILRKLGFPGYRLHWKKAKGRPDIAYPGRKVAIFVNGCFWHDCPHCKPAHPKTNTEFWETKLRDNVERDRRAVEALEAEGWTVVTVWECELKKTRIEHTERYLYSVLEG